MEVQGIKVLGLKRKTPGGKVYNFICPYCDSLFFAFLSNVRQKRTKSCGCYGKEVARQKQLTHGQRRTRLYSIWTNIKTRVYSENRHLYWRYDHVGMLEEWKNSFESFYEWAMANGYQEDLTIDRIDNNKGYYPDNCRWADNQTQSRNRDYAWYITIDGVTKHAKDWCEIYGVKYKAAHNRKMRGWSYKDCVTTPLRKHPRQKTKGKAQGRSTDLTG